MDRITFSKILLSRFLQLDEADKYGVIEVLVHVTEKDQDEWAQNMVELLFPETIGEVKSLDEWSNE